MNELMNMSVSVVLPVYNGEKYLSLSIESCLNQTHKNIELIIVNDCSTDSTLEIANKYAQRDSRIKIVNNPENKKLPASLNIGHKHAKGDYISWTSDDNIYEVNAIEELLNGLLENKADIVYTDFYLIDNFGNEIKEVKLLGLENMIFGNFIGACFLYKKEVFEKNNGYDETLFLVEDYDFWLRALINSKYYKIGQFLYKYRSHDNSLSSQIDKVNDKQILWRKNISKVYSKFSKNFIKDHEEDVINELQTKILTHQKIEFDWVIENYPIIKKFQKSLSMNTNFHNKKNLGKVFMNKLIVLMKADYNSEKGKYYCFFIFKNYFSYLDKNSFKTLLKYSFFK
jgi:glycosyltransferase involved in cell wall biosynthesis